jgi:hypothetical protein
MKKALILFVIFQSWHLSYSQEKERMIARSSYYYSSSWPTTIDSSRYVYSDTFGSVNSFYGDYGYVNSPIGFDQGIYYAFDSSVAQPQSRTLNVYDAFHRVISDTFQKFINNSWIGSTLDSYLYDSAGNVLIRQTDTFAINTGIWAVASVDTAIYDQTGHMLTSSGYYLDFYGRHSNYYTYSYDTLGNVTEKIWVESNIFGSNSSDTKTIYSYDSLGNILVALGLNYYSGVWINQSLDSSTYSYPHNLLSSTTFEWDDYSFYGAQFWRNTYKHLYQYDVQGNQTAYAYYIEHSNSGRLYISSAGHRTFNLNHQILTEGGDDYQMGTYVGSGLRVYTYDANFNTLSLTISQGDSNNLAPYLKYELTYDSLNYLTHEADGQYGNGTWTNTADYYYWYDTISLGSKTTDKSIKSGVYPNPATGNFMIVTDSQTTGQMDILIYDINGSIVSRAVTSLQTGMNKLNYDAAALTPGVYIYELQINGATTRGKIVMQ